MYLNIIYLNLKIQLKLLMLKLQKQFKKSCKYYNKGYCKFVIIIIKVTVNLVMSVNTNM